MSQPEVAEPKFRSNALSSTNLANLYYGHDKIKQIQESVLLCG